jgi:hypothetical protein
LEEAVAHHREAAAILQQLLVSVVHHKARESIRLQAEFHQKEQLLIHDFRARCDAIAENLERIKSRRHAMEAGEEAASATPAEHGFRQLRAGAGDNLHTNIYRAFEETESLLDRLKEKDASGFPQSCPSDPVAMTRQSVVNSATKKPKDDKVIIEELEVANCHLRRMVDSLFIELDQCQKENLALREKIRYKSTCCSQYIRRPYLIALIPFAAAWKSSWSKASSVTNNAGHRHMILVTTKTARIFRLSRHSKFLLSNSRNE